MDNLNKYTEKIRLVGKKLIDDYLATGHVKTGINGPYDDPETEVRNLSHLIIITAIEYMKFGKVEYKALISKMTSELVAMKSPDGTYKMRQKDGKDQCNGVIGHAWLMEGLMYAYKATGEREYVEECYRIAKMHEFNEKMGLWGRPNCGIDDIALDYTLNHQLWYAATIAELLEIDNDPNLEKELNRFMDFLHKNFVIGDKGRITHCIYRRQNHIIEFKLFIKRIIYHIYEKFNRPSMKYKENGYHTFNLMALARLYHVNDTHKFFGSQLFKKAVNFVVDETYYRSLLSKNLCMDRSYHGTKLKDEEKSLNIYGYPYNVPSFELLYCSLILGKPTLEVSVRSLSTQFKTTYNQSENIFGLNTHDKCTLNYRIYEYYRLLEVL